VAIPQVTSVLITALAASLFLDAAGASAGSSWRSSHRLPGACRNNTNQGALGHSYQSLKPSPGEIRGLGSRHPEIRVTPGTPGGPKYYPKAMRPIEPE